MLRDPLVMPRTGAVPKNATRRPAHVGERTRAQNGADDRDAGREQLAASCPASPS